MPDLLVSGSVWQPFQEMRAQGQYDVVPQLSPEDLLAHLLDRAKLSHDYVSALHETRLRLMSGKEKIILPRDPLFDKLGALPLGVFVGSLLAI